MHNKTYGERGKSPSRGTCASTGEIAVLIDKLEGMSRARLLWERSRLEELQNGLGVNPAEFDRLQAVKALLTRKPE